MHSSCTYQVLISSMILYLQWSFFFLLVHTFRRVTELTFQIRFSPFFYFRPDYQVSWHSWSVRQSDCCHTIRFCKLTKDHNVSVHTLLLWEFHYRSKMNDQNTQGILPSPSIMSTTPETREAVKLGSLSLHGHSYVSALKVGKSNRLVCTPFRWFRTQCNGMHY